MVPTLNGLVPVGHMCQRLLIVISMCKLSNPKGESDHMSTATIVAFPAQTACPVCKRSCGEDELSYCYPCHDQFCDQCSECSCDRLAVMVADWIEWNRPTLFFRVQRWLKGW